MTMERFLRRPLFTGFSPNITFGQTITACSFLFLPWRWRRWRHGAEVQKVEEWLKGYFEVKDAITFDSGRSALFYALTAFGIGPGDEVLVQAYTCVVVVNAIRWTGARPVYIDVGDDFNMDPAELEKKISPSAKCLIIQHTFGQPARLSELLAIAKAHNLKTIEDCAHSLGARYNGKKVGTFADAAILSFGSDKVVSCARGGAVVTNNELLTIKLRDLQKKLPSAKLKTVAQHLLHFPFFWLGRATYTWGLGKALLGLAKRYFIINRVIWPDEKRGRQPDFFPCLFPNALAQILIPQLTSLEATNDHRRKIAAGYGALIVDKKIQKPLFGQDPGCIFLRYPILVEHTAKVHTHAEADGVFLGNWYDTPIAPKDIDMAMTGYVLGSCPKAEFLSAHSINLPTNIHIQDRDIKRIVQSIHT